MASRHTTAAIAGLSPATFSGRAFRHQAVEWQYSQPGAGARSVGGRWNPPNSFATLYLALSEEVAEAELLRLATRAGRAVDDFMPRHLLEFEVKLERLLDLTNAEAVAEMKLDENLLRADDPRQCQEIGEAAHHLGLEGILAPSATGSGVVLAVFVERLLPHSQLELIQTTVWNSVAGKSTGGDPTTE